MKFDFEVFARTPPSEGGLGLSPRDARLFFFAMCLLGGDYAKFGEGGCG
jgi:hypothetical protein